MGRRRIVSSAAADHDGTNGGLTDDGLVIDGSSRLDAARFGGASGFLLWLAAVGSRHEIVRIDAFEYVFADNSRNSGCISFQYFVPAVIACSVLTFIGWAILGPEPRLAHAFVAAVAVLIIACPCALGLATPMSVMVGVGRGAKNGVLIKNAEVLEIIEKIDTVVVDKSC